MRHSAAAMAVVLAMTPAAVRSQLSVVQGPVEADIVRVIDADTYEFISFPFPELAVWGQLRLDGVDSPEKRGDCAYETNLAAEATTFVLNAFAAANNRVKLYVVGLKGTNGGGFGRYRAGIRVGSMWLADELITRGYARENHGEPRTSWCIGR